MARERVMDTLAVRFPDHPPLRRFISPVHLHICTTRAQLTAVAGPFA